jgi:magnesium transporter
MLTKEPVLPLPSETTTPTSTAIPKVIPPAAGVLLPDAGAGNGRSPREIADRADRPEASELVLAYAFIHGKLEELADTDAITAAFSTSDATLWIDIRSPAKATLETIAKCLQLHPLIVEDMVERNQRAKVELTGDVLHLVMFALQFGGDLATSEIDIVLGQRFLLTTHDADWDPHGSHNLRNGVEPILKQGPDFVLWAVVDWLVDGYFPVFDRLSDEIDQLQDDVIARPNKWLVERLFQVRRDLLAIRHAVNPQREIFNQLTNRNLPFILEPHIVYFRDVYDHLIRLTDELDSYREMVSTTLDAYLSTVNNNLSEIMKRLTAVTTVIAGVGAAAGIFGMSEAGLALSFTSVDFWAVTLFVLGIGAVLYVYFKRIQWI